MRVSVENLAALCRAYGISRQTGYKWLSRYLAAHGRVEALADRSRRPHTSPDAIPDDVVDLLIKARKARPYWGPVTSVAVGFSERGAGCEVRCPEEQHHCEGVFRAAVWALWRAGASDAALDDFFAEYYSGSDEVEVLGRWIRIDGDGGDPARLEALRRAVRGSPLASWLGAPEQPAHFFVRADKTAFDEVVALLETFHAVSLRGGDDAVASLRSAMRQDPDVLVARAGALTAELVAELPRAVAVGTSLVLFGDAPAADQPAATIAAVGPVVFDRRAPRSDR
jgi:hypothetical protein